MLIENNDDYKVLIKILVSHPGSSTRDLRKHLKVSGHDWDKTKINSLLYKMLNANLVSKEILDGTRPYWTAQTSGLQINTAHFEEAKRIIMGENSGNT
jgi:predicted transcriptional regulator